MKPSKQDLTKDYSVSRDVLLRCLKHAYVSYIYIVLVGLKVLTIIGEHVYIRTCPNTCRINLRTQDQIQTVMGKIIPKLYRAQCSQILRFKKVVFGNQNIDLARTEIGNSHRR